MPRVVSKRTALAATWLMAAVLQGVQGLPTNDSAPTNSTSHKLLCIMLDGFRWDYVDQQPEKLPGFKRFLTEGVRANWTNPSFPVLSYPMWTTLGTGLYPEVHNIAGNNIYDPEDKVFFSLDIPKTTTNKKWWTAEPIWITSTRAGIDTAALAWSQCAVPWDGITPRHCEPYGSGQQNSKSFRTGIKRALDFLEQDYGFVMLYSVDTDDVGHVSGPESEELLEEVQFKDKSIGFLLDQLDERGLANETNVVIVSDHGMTTTDPAHLITYDIDDYLDTKLVEKIVEFGALMNIKVPQENVEKVYQQLSKIPEGVDIYRHDDIPDRFHYRNSKYAHEILIVAHKGYYIFPTADQSKQIPPPFISKNYGQHGYDPDVMDMKGVFFAKGPDFVEDTVIPPIEMVDVYQVLCHLIDLEALPNNGTWDHVSSALAMPATGDRVSAGTRPMAGSSALVAFFGLLLTLTVARGSVG